MDNTAKKIETLPSVRGEYRENAPLGAVGWFRAGGTADVLFKPADRDDLQQFLANYGPSPDPRVPLGSPSPLREREATAQPERGEGIHIFGVLSNTIVRDGGMRGVTVRLGKEFANIEVLPGHRIRAGALALDASVAKVAAEAGIAGLEFFSGIPGTVGGALRMNAGCYGTETKDVLIEAEALDRAGNVHIYTRCHSGESRNLQGIVQKDPGFRRDDGGGGMNLSYRHNSLPDDYIFTGAVFQGRAGDPEKIAMHMKEIKEKREASQPIREKTGGSTFANPSAEDIARANLPEGTKVWQLIDRAGCRGLRLGGAIMSELHCNFMINTGTATAADLENLGEEVRRRVYEDCGITLRWEIKRVGEK